MTCVYCNYYIIIVGTKECSNIHLLIAKMFDDHKLMYHHNIIFSVELCPKVSDQPYRIRNQYDRTIGGRTKFSCMAGFIMIGVPELVCKRNGKWSDKEPTCYSKSKCLYICRATILVYCYNYSCRGMWKCTCYPQWKGCTKWREIWRHGKLYL